MGSQGLQETRLNCNNKQLIRFEMLSDFTVKMRLQHSEEKTTDEDI